MKTVGAATFIHNGDEFDYCYRETVACLKEFADEVVVLDAGSTDGSDKVCRGFEDSKTKVICLPNEEWVKHKGRTKVSHFQNEAKKHLNTDYYLLIQADEILHEKSFPFVREAIQSERPGYMVSRFNLWFDPWHKLNVPQERKPCSSEVIRLAKTCYDSVDDGESIAVPSLSFGWLPKIRIYHMGFVRDGAKMKSKSIHMQDKIFGVEHDKRLDGSDVFEPGRFFDPKKDVDKIFEELPVFIKEWATKRYPNGSVI